jgi:diguanylate cyclase (GGDEF)-like protein
LGDGDLPGYQSFLARRTTISAGIRQFSSDSSGTAAVSYAVVLAVVVGSALTGAALLGSSVERTFSKVSTGTSVPGGPETEGRTETSSSRAVAQTPPATAGTSRALIMFIMVTVPVVTVAGGWLILREPRKKPQPAPTARKKSVVEEVLLTRLNAKREILWQQLIDDHDLLLKNQIEVRHVMTQHPIVIDKSTSGKEIAKLIAKHKVRHLLVCDKDKNLLGVVRASDHRADPSATAEAILTPPRSSIAPKSTLGGAISTLIDKGVSFLPVVDQGILRGVLTPTDLVLTLHCSLQLWYRVAQTMETSSKRAEILEETSQSMADTANQLKQQVKRLPEQVKTVIQTGKADGLVAEIDHMTNAVSQLMKQLDDAQTQIREQNEQIADLKEPAPDEATGTTSRQQFDRVIEKLIDQNRTSGEPLSVILFAAENHQQILQEEGQSAADDHLRELAECVARMLSPKDHLARYGEDALAIILPNRTSTEARQLCTQLTEAVSPILGDMSSSNSYMSIVAARTGESAEELMARAEGRQVCESRTLELVASE